MIDHMGMGVGDYAAAKRFYGTALAPLGYELLMDLSAEVTQGTAACGFGKSGCAPDFWIADEAPAGGLHIGFRADSREQVDAFHAACLEAGATDNGAPGLRPHYHLNYYAAFAFDLDGNNIETVHHGAVGTVEQVSY